MNTDKKYICKKCGYKDTAVVKKHIRDEGGIRRTVKCPRCDNLWDVDE